MLDIYGTLEIGQVLNEIVSYSHTEIGKDKISSLKMLPLEDAKNDLVKLEEMIQFVAKFGALPLVASSNLKQIVDVASKGGVLTPLELEHVASDILTSQKLYSFFKKADRSTTSNILAIVESLNDLTKLEARIHSVVAPNLSIKDNASPVLASIRSKLLKKENEIRERSSSLIVNTTSIAGLMFACSFLSFIE